MTPEKLTAISAITALVSLGLCGANIYLVLHSMQHGAPQSGWHQPFYAPILGPAAVVELAGLLAGIMGLIYALIWKLVRYQRRKKGPA